MDQIIETPTALHHCDWYQQFVGLFLKVCKMHGRTASQHHNQLVDKFITRPAQSLNEQHMDKLTASGPPLDVLLRSLETLRDLRLAAPRDDIPTRYTDVQRIKASVESI